MSDRSTPAFSTERQFVRRLLILALFLVVAVLLWRIVGVLLLAFGAVVVAVILHAVADPLARRLGIAGSVALAATVLLLALGLGLALWLFGSEVTKQLDQLGNLLPGAWQATEQQLRATTAGRQFLAWLQTLADRSFTGAGTLVMNLGAAVAGLVAMLIGGIYLAAQPSLYRGGLLKLVPRSSRPVAQETLDSAGGALRLWLLGQLLAMLIVGLLTGLGAWLIGLPSPMAIGLLAGLLEFIPYAGPLLMAVPALLAAATVGTEAMILTLVLLTAVQQLEGNVVTPLVQRRTVTLPPALTLFAMIAMGVVFGPLGVVLAAPLTVVAYVAVKELYIRHTLGEDTRVPGEPGGGG